MTSIERFEAKYTRGKADECWLWTAGLSRWGYGAFWVDGKQVKAHRFSYEACGGPVSDGLFVLHRCDVRRCVNPAHLFLGSHAENMKDMVEKGRQALGGRHYSRRYPERRPKGERHGSAKLTEAQVLEICAIKGEKHASIAARFGVSRSLVSKIRRGELWAHAK